MSCDLCPIMETVLVETYGHTDGATILWCVNCMSHKHWVSVSVFFFFSWCNMIINYSKSLHNWITTPKHQHTCHVIITHTHTHTPYTQLLFVLFSWLLNLYCWQQTLNFDLNPNLENQKVLIKNTFPCNSCPHKENTTILFLKYCPCKNTSQQ